MALARGRGGNIGMDMVSWLERVWHRLDRSFPKSPAASDLSRGGARTIPRSAIVAGIALLAGTGVVIALGIGGVTAAAGQPPQSGALPAGSGGPGDGGPGGGGHGDGGSPSTGPGAGRH